MSSTEVKVVQEETQSLVTAFEELEDYAGDVTSASFKNAPDTIRRYYSVLHSAPIGPLLAELLPGVDFGAWYKTALATQRGMIGSAHLEWPVDPAERVALQLELIKRIAEKHIDVIDFSYTFTYADNDFNLNLSEWVSQVFMPFHRDLVRLVRQAINKELAAAEVVPGKVGETSQLVPSDFVNESRIAELKTIQSSSFDLTRLIELCREIDFCYRHECYLAVAALTRALLDHVPPIFGFSSFTEVARNYSGGKSFRDSMQHLEKSARKIGDANLHTQIRRRESLPTPTQVNFANDLDVLLAEILRILK